jgi:hypothetical protein
MATAASTGTSRRPEHEHKTYEALKAAITTHLERRIAEANKAQRGAWEHTLKLVEAFDALGPWPEPYRVSIDATDPGGELKRLRENSDAIDDYYERAHAAGVDL